MPQYILEIVHPQPCSKHPSLPQYTQVCLSHTFPYIQSPPFSSFSSSSSSSSSSTLSLSRCSTCLVAQAAPLALSLPRLQSAAPQPENT
ncbi:hypothetical protein E2C01_071436 [Portunus trituberculatus]|uniref:Uncharacterized protein n=1 Tax=Portunus trituberculatus TaxID=210409 RepID=A0A5B7I540_PORTR|nr:hypothetical protein [Portunus trituberculatus]